MASRSELVLQQIDYLLGRAGLSAGESHRGWTTVSHTERTALATAWAAGIQRLAPRSSSYREQLERSQELLRTQHPDHLDSLVGILNALRNDYEARFMTALEELIHADVFADFLGMAAELLDKTYKDPAAVLTGSVLEEHLRKLCDRFQVPTEAPRWIPTQG